MSDGMRDVVGIVLVDKPSGITSNRVLQRVKRLYRAKKAGHTGTLDPIATGMLPICFGQATRVAGFMLNARKQYRVTAVFGVATDTADAVGEVIGRCEAPAPERRVVQRAVTAMIGPGRQVPPMYSALKRDGKRLYDLARQGIDVPREARPIEVFDLAVETFEWPRVTLRVHCSKGTYVRSLVTDLASRLGTLAHVGELRRLGVEPFDADRMVSLATLEREADRGDDALDAWLLDADAALVGLPAISVGIDQTEALRQGRAVTLGDGGPAEAVRLYDPQGHFVGIGTLDASGTARPKRIFPCRSVG